VARRFHVYSHDANPAIDSPSEYVNSERKDHLISLGICKMIGPRALQRVRTRKFDNRGDKEIKNKQPFDFAQIDSGATGWRMVAQTQKPCGRGRVQVGPGCPRFTIVW